MPTVLALVIAALALTAAVATVVRAAVDGGAPRAAPCPPGEEWSADLPSRPYAW